MTVHLFGATSSPGCATYGLRQIAKDYEHEFDSDVANFIRRNFYVDDGLISLKSEQNASTLMLETVKLCEKGGLRLHKFTSNSEAVLKSVCTNYVDKIMDLGKRDDGFNLIERALGICWNIEMDQFEFRISLRDKPLTRRGIMSTISSIYAPLGFVAPVLLRGRQILQSICREGSDWDDPVPENLRAAWERWRIGLMDIDKVCTPRCYKPSNFGSVVSVELHHFSDASQDGYGQCSYLRFVDENDQIHCAFVMGKSRVTPAKAITIPRLELVAALLSVKISAFLARELDYGSIPEIFWTDSRVVLGYISNEVKRFHVFVANRVQQIRDHTNPGQWRHVRGCDNPADEASRGLSVSDFIDRSIWLSGPAFLWEKSIPYPPDDCKHICRDDDPEVKEARVFASVSTTSISFDITRFQRYSSWSALQRAVGLCLRYMQVLKVQASRKNQVGSVDQLPAQRLSVNNLQEADNVIMKVIQRHCFPEELRILKGLQHDMGDRATLATRNKTLKQSSSLRTLDPFVDYDGLIKVGGRLSQAKYPRSMKYPIILPRNNHVTKLLLRYFHQKAAHQGRGMTTNEVRANGFWVIGCSSAVKQLISNCVICRRNRGTVQEQKMADLPADRVDPASPFTYCAVDYFGPFLVKEGRKQLKRYGVLFTCMSCRAVHIEVADSLSTDSFINALRRFIAIRGPVRQIRSDRGTNFVGAQRELDHEALSNYLTKENCDECTYCKSPRWCMGEADPNRPQCSELHNRPSGSTIE